MGQLQSDLLSQGYLPKELPPSYSSSNFAALVTSNIAAMPAIFRDQRRITKVAAHSLARAGGLRRRLGIPNPVSQFNLCEAVESNWTDIDRILSESRLSTTTPRTTGGNRAATPENRFGDLVEQRADARAASRFVLKTDIAEFYHSIYSHSIPWAVHTRQTAKSNRTYSLYGNLLDLWIRNSQDGQTLGVPVGPDTSFIIAELILSQIDVDLVGRFPDLRGFRFFDDYELCFSTLGDAEEVLATLQFLLQEYELRLNPRKTAIERLPRSAELEWITPIRSFAFRESEGRQRIDVARYFELVFNLFNKHDGDAVVPYAISRLEGADLEVKRANWPLLQDYLCQSMVVDPTSLPQCLRQLLKAKRDRNYEINVDLVAKTANLLIGTHARLGHSSEVAWSIWASLALGFSVQQHAAQQISNMEDSVVALLALEARAAGFMPQGLSTSRWESCMDPAGLYGEHWLLSYEANVKGWIPSTGGGDHVASDPNFGWLKSLGVNFVSTTTQYPPYEGIQGPELDDYA